MVYELVRLLQVSDKSSAACQWHMMLQYCCDSGITNKLFCMWFLLDRKPISDLNVWLY